jgi:hypothetical protein
VPGSGYQGPGPASPENIENVLKKKQRTFSLSVNGRESINGSTGTPEPGPWNREPDFDNDYDNDNEKCRRRRPRLPGPETRNRIIKLTPPAVSDIKYFS